MLNDFNEVTPDDIDGDMAFVYGKAQFDDRILDQIPSYSIVDIDESVYIIKSLDSDEYYIFLYPNGYPEELEALQEVAQVKLIPEAYVCLSGKEFDILRRLCNRFQIEQERKNLESLMDKNAEDKPDSMEQGGN